VGQTQKPARWHWWLVLVPFLAVGIAGGGYLLKAGPGAGTAEAAGQPAEPGEETAASEAPAGAPVEVVHPRVGDMDRTTTQPGTVQSYEFANLYAGVSGYLKTQTVDIGDRVKRGQVLATVDVPDLEKQVQKCLAASDQAKARVNQMKARVTSAQADLEAAKAAVTLADATARSKAAELRFRQKQLDRMKDLFALKSIDERLVDEKTEQRDAAQEAERSAVAAIATAKAQVAAAAAKIEQAEADVLEAQAEVKVAQADLEKAQVMVRFATIPAPFEGVITHRSFFPGDYVRAATESGSHLPLLTVERTDRMRVVVQVPDRDVPYADPGDPAYVELDALPGQTFRGTVSRIANSEDPSTRLMHVEIDLPNPTGKICQGMFGRVKIILQKSDLLSVPSSCLTSRAEDGKATVFVLRDGHARRVPIRISEDNGVKVGIISGLKAGDEVVNHPSRDLLDNAAVVVVNREPAPGGKAAAKH
jgi:RND family efflux transporter MFP subunit